MSAPVPAQTKQALTLLVVDDERLVAEMIRMTAADAGFDAVAVSDQTQISASMAVARDLVVLDLQMPGKDGVEIIRELAAQRNGAAVFLASGLGDRMLAAAAELAEAQGLRVMGVIAKPFLYEDLFEILLRIKESLCVLTQPEASSEYPPIAPENLRTAILRGEVQAFYQPIVSLSTRALVAAEALARWQHTQFGTLLPAAFVPLAERYDLGKALDWAVLRYSIADMKAHCPNQTAPLSVNFCAHDFSDLDLPDRVADLLSEAGLPPALLNVELTESALIQDLPRALDTMMRLRMKGVGLWLDDFGTGYSSMEQLRRLPLTAVKIDKSFTPRPGNWEKNLALLHTLVDIAHKLGLPAIAEGVETPVQIQAARDIGCDYAQGFGIADPMPGNLFAEWLNSRKSV